MFVLISVVAAMNEKRTPHRRYSRKLGLLSEKGHDGTKLTLPAALVN